MLQWLTFSARPLRLEELAEIVAIDVHETPRFDPERRWPEPRDILVICSSLVSLTAIDDDDISQRFSARKLASASKDSEMYIRLAHFSVKEYLVSDRIQQSIAMQYSVQEIASHGVLAEDCIAYLLQFDHPGSLTPGSFDLYPLIDYAANSWTSHARQVERIAVESTSHMAMELLMSNGESLLNLIRIADPDSFWPMNKLSIKKDHIASPIYYASSFGLPESVKMLIQRGTNVNAQGGRYGNALQVASYSGHEDVVQVLLNNGADINAQGGHFGNALQAAAYSGYKDIVQVLIDNRADVSAQGGDFGSALQAASYSEYDDIVQVLIDNGADVNTQGGICGNALQAASYLRPNGIIQILLDHGADINIVGPKGSALQLASTYGCEDVVKMLLDKGADINALGSKGSALQLASKEGNKDTVKMLLDHGADINIVGPKGSALHLASTYGREDVVKMLLDKRADINAIGPKGSALQLALLCDNKSIVKMLLDHGADVNADLDESAVQTAFRKGYYDIVDLLVAKGAVMPEKDAKSQAWGQYKKKKKKKIEKETGDDDDDSPTDIMKDSNAVEAPSVQNSFLSVSN